MGGIEQTSVLQACACSFLAVICVLSSVLIAILVVIFEPDQAPHDFLAVGTLSNIVQDTSRPCGRLFTTGLFTGCLLQMMSMYTCWLYRPWVGHRNHTEFYWIG